MTIQPQIKIFCVDDHPLMRVGVASIVNARSDMTVVAQTGSGEEAVTLFFKHKPDVTLMDLRLPGMSGVDLLREIRRKRQDLPGYKILVNCHPAVADLLTGSEKAAVQDAESKYMRRIQVSARTEYHIEQFDLAGQ